MEKVKPVGIWVRVSTEDQAKGESSEHHEKRARFYAESKGPSAPFRPRKSFDGNEIPFHFSSNK